jgi:nitroreductase
MNAEELELITTFASLAPSVHNTQPWQFVAEGHTLEVRADPTRQLAFLDESARQLHMSCGAAVEFARLAVRALGYSCIVRLLPRSDDPLLLATLTLGGTSLPAPGERRLYAAAPRRYTDRGPYEDKPVPPAMLTRMADAAAEVGCWLRVLNRPGDRLLAAILLEKAESIEAQDPRYREELSEWRRDGAALDGVPDAAVPAWPADRVSDVPLRDFTRDGADPALDRRRYRPDVERDALVLVGSDGDDRLSWLRSGRALAAVWLTATDAGLASQPLGQVTDVAATRHRLQRGLGLLGYPQLMLRMGFGHGRPATGRRPIEDTLVVGAVA